MFAYCLNCPTVYADASGSCACTEKGGISPSAKYATLCCVCGGTGSGYMGPTDASEGLRDITDELNKAMKTNALDLKYYAIAFGELAAAFYFAEQVKQGGAWDLKSQEEWDLVEGEKYIYNGKEISFDDAGNIHYGFVGRVLFSEETLLLFAGAYQIYSGTSSSSYASSNFDEPHDQAAIRYGYSLWEILVYEKD